MPTLNEEFSEAKEEAWLNELLKKMDLIRQEPYRFNKRWVWELIQNARDAARRNKADVNVSVSFRNGMLEFKHDGGSFTEKDIARIICPGSSKQADPDAVGQYGSGFIATFVLSETVEIGGTCNSNAFTFNLDRTGSSIDSLRKGAEDALQQFANNKIAASDSRTVFRYIINSSVAQHVVDGIQSLRAHAMLAMSFNDEIKSIEIITENDRTLIHKDKVIASKETVEVVKFDLKRFRNLADAGTLGCDESNEEILGVIRSRKRSGTQISMMVGIRGEQFAVRSLENLSRLFVAFPLLGSSEFAFPGVLHSLELTPDEQRHHVSLKADHAKTVANRGVVEEALNQGVEFVRDAARLPCSEIWNALNVPSAETSEWIDQKWIRAAIQSRLIKPLCALPMMATLEGQHVSMSEARIPTAAGALTAGELWQSALKLEQFRMQLPVESEVSHWQQVADSWQRWLDPESKTPPQFQRLTIDDVCQSVAAVSDLKALALKLVPGTDPVEWLTELYASIIKANRIDLFTKYKLLLTQTGLLAGPLASVRHDGCDHELKEIARELQPSLLDWLCDPRVESPPLGLAEKKTEELLNDTIAILKKATTTDPELRDRFLVISSKLLAWTVGKNLDSRMTDLPLATDDAGTIVKLSKTQTVLQPTQRWPEWARCVEPLILPKYRLHPFYADHVPQSVWKDLLNRGLINADPVLVSSRHVSNFEKEKSPLLGVHKSKELQDVLEITQFDAMLAAANGNRKNAQILVTFVLNVLREYGLNPTYRILVECTPCKTPHLYRPAALLLKLKDRWLPADDQPVIPDGRSLAKLVEDDRNLRSQLMEPHGRALLDMFGISPGEFQMTLVIKDDKARDAVLGEISQLIDHDGPEAFLERHRDMIRKEEQGRFNKDLGEHVESLLQSVLEAEHFTIKLKSVGSDREVMLGEEVPTDSIRVEVTSPEHKLNVLIEVKATRDGAAKMTISQARTAATWASNYALCVVPLDGEYPDKESVRSQARIVVDIGEQIRPTIDRFAALNDAGAATDSRVELVIEKSTTRVAVKRAIWESGMTFATFVEWLRNRALLSPDAPILGNPLQPVIEP